MPENPAQGLIRSSCSKWWAVLGSNQWPLPCETEVGCLRIKDMRVGPPTATRTWCHLISLDITQCHGRTVPKLSQRSFSRVSCLPRAGSNRGQDFASVYHRPAFSSRLKFRHLERWRFRVRERTRTRGITRFNHWMLLWPFDAKTAGMGTVMRDAGTMVMFAGTLYAHLQICGSP